MNQSTPEKNQGESDDEMQLYTVDEETNVLIHYIPEKFWEIDGYEEIISNILEANDVKNVRNMRNRALVRNGYYFDGERLVITLSGFPQKGRPGSYLVRNERGVFIIMSTKNLLETYPQFKTTVELDLERSKRCHTS